jgi:gluconate kinase
MATVVLVIGVAGSGKSWACRKAAGSKFRYIAHDACWRHADAKPAKDKNGGDVKWGPPGSVSTHWESLVTASRRGSRPILTEAPFGETRLRERLEKAGVEVVPVFVIEKPGVISARYQAREGKMPPEGVMTRAAGLKTKADEWGAFAGTSDEVLEHLKGLKP